MEEPSSEPRESSPANLVALKTAATALRDQIYRLEREEEFKNGGGRRASASSTSNGGGSVSVRQSKATEKPRKKLAEVEAQLLLASPGLVFQVRRVYVVDNDAQRRRWARLKAKGVEMQRETAEIFHDRFRLPAELDSAIRDGTFTQPLSVQRA